MRIEREQLAGGCACGAAHGLTTRLLVIEAGCLGAFEHYLTDMGLRGSAAALYDTNTYHAKGLARPRVAQEIVLPAGGLRADERAVEAVLHQLAGDTAFLVAIGGGTVHDIARYCAHRLSLPLVACPTAASCDGYASPVCSMTWRGEHAVMPGVAPTLVLADLDVIERAPHALARAGMGDALSKHTALADWRVAALLGDVPHACIATEAHVRQVATLAEGASTGLLDGDPGAHAQLMYALLLSGLAVQLHGDVRPILGLEHMLSQLLDCRPDAVATPHGEQVGACAALVAGLYHRLAGIEDIAPLIRPVRPLDARALSSYAGPRMADAVLARSTPDCLSSIDPDTLIRQWPAIRRVLGEIPTEAALRGTMTSLGGVTPEALGVAPSRLADTLVLASAMRNQLTAGRLLRMLKGRYASSADASLPPSRKSRYADSAIKRAGSSKPVSAASMR